VSEPERTTYDTLVGAQAPRGTTDRVVLLDASGQTREVPLLRFTTWDYWHQVVDWIWDAHGVVNSGLDDPFPTETLHLFPEVHALMMRDMRGFHLEAVMFAVHVDEDYGKHVAFDEGLRDLLNGS
jgi:hypothetical protein